MDWYVNDNSEKYYNYFAFRSYRSIGSTLKIEYEDSSIETYTYDYYGTNEIFSFFDKNGNEISLSEIEFNDSQEIKHWSKDEKYNYYTVSYLGVSCQVPVFIVDDLTIEDISIKQIKCVDNSLTHWDLSKNGFFEYKITYSDGSVEHLSKFLSDGAGFNSISGFFCDGKYIFGLFLSFENNKNLVGTTLKILFDFDNVVNKSLISNHIDEKTDKAIKPTCTKTGLTEGKHCLKCGEIIVEQKVVSKLVHTYKTYTTKATTSADGKIVKKCIVCGKVASTTVIPKASSVKLSATSYTYDGNSKKPTVTVKDSKGNKISSANYTVTYSNNKYVGKASVKITFKGNYSGSKTLYFTINPKGTTISSFSGTTKGFKVSWKKQATQTTGYQIQYSTSSKFTNPKTVTVTKNSTTSKSISKLTAKKKYYVRVRAYKTVNGNKYYSAWSSTKSVTTKK